MDRRQFIQCGSLAIGSSMIVACANSNQPQSKSHTTGDKLDKVTFGASWVAEAEHGGFYQAIATGKVMCIYVA